MEEVIGRTRLAVVLLTLLAATLAGCGTGAAGSGAVTGAPAPASARPVDPGPSTRASTPAAPPAAEQRRRRPNFLVIETDDMRWDDLRWMPQVRRLVQRRGLSFESSFAPYPLCCPSRASFLTGRYAHNHKVLSHAEPFGFASFRDRRTIATLLQGAGYRTALVGKYLNGYGEQALRPSGEPSLNYVPPGWNQWWAASDHEWGTAGPFYGGTYHYFDLVQNVNGGILASPGRYSTDVLAEQTRSLIDRFDRTGDPWFVWWNPVAPHHGSPVEADDPPPSLRADGHYTQWVTPARPDWVKGRFDARITHGSGTPLTGSAEKHVEDKPRYLRRQPELTATERLAVTGVTRQRAESLFALDVQIGRTLTELGRSGGLANTVVMVTSDNGYYLGEHRKRQGKINLHEPSLRVPLVVSGPGVPRGKRYDPVSTVDLAPTIAAYAGVRMRNADGVDLTGLVEGGDRGWDRPVVTEAMMPEGRYAQLRRLGPSPLNTRGLRLGRWKITRYSTGEVELYDLAKDPLELRNLSRVRGFARVRADLVALQRRYGDCRGAQCRAALPLRYRATPEEVRRITEKQQRATSAHFGR